MLKNQSYYSAPDFSSNCNQHNKISILPLFTGCQFFHVDILAKLEFILIFNNLPIQNSWGMETKYSWDWISESCFWKSTHLLCSKDFCNCFPCVISLILQTNFELDYAVPIFTDENRKIQRWKHGNIKKKNEAVNKLIWKALTCLESFRK